MIYLTAKELSEKWNISPRRICILCKEGRIAGAIKKGSVWMIPQNAKKPDDGRKTEIKKAENKNGFSPLFLVINPTYFDNKSINPSEEDKVICEIQEKYLRGNIRDAYSDIDKALLKCKDDSYRCVYYFLKFVIGADLGINEAYVGTGKMLLPLIENNSYLVSEKALVDLYLRNTEKVIDTDFDEREYDELLPLISAIVIKNNINRIITNQAKADLSCYELLCHELEKRDCPLINAYINLYLAIFYNITGEISLFEKHYNKALEILLPRKWYTPLAEYSATVDLRYIENIDEEAYKVVGRLSEEIICAYMKIGIFDKIEYQNKNKYSFNIQIGYKLFQGKSNEVIAQELGISRYKVKKQMDELFFALGINTKKELREFILRNCFV